VTCGFALEKLRPETLLLMLIASFRVLKFEPTFPSASGPVFHIGQYRFYYRCTLMMPPCAEKSVKFWAAEILVGKKLRNIHSNRATLSYPLIFHISSCLCAEKRRLCHPGKAGKSATMDKYKRITSSNQFRLSLPKRKSDLVSRVSECTIIATSVKQDRFWHSFWSLDSQSSPTSS
jgi:hypothetical protein